MGSLRSSYLDFDTTLVYTASHVKEVLNEDIQLRPSTLPDFHPQRAIRAEGFYGFDEALKQDV